MAILTEQQLQNGYFRDIGGFPPAKTIHTIAEYDGAKQCCIACTQLSDSALTERERKQTLGDWIHFLKTNTTTFEAIHFNCRVPQALFDAVCYQENLVELRCKWGRYPDLSALAGLKNLQYLYLGSCSSVEDLAPITQLNNLVVLYLENFKRIEDYSPLAVLTNLEQLIISGPILGIAHIKDLDFLCDMPNLLSIWRPNTILRNKYSPEQQEHLRARLPNLQGIYSQAWWL